MLRTTIDDTSPTNTLARRWYLRQHNAHPPLSPFTDEILIHPLFSPPLIWEVVVGYVREGDAPVTALSALGGVGTHRTYKTLVLRRDTLEFVKMEPYRDSEHA